MEQEAQQPVAPEPEYPPCAPIADTGGIGLLPFPRIFVPRGAPFRVQPVSYLYISSRANQNTRRKFHLFSERLDSFGVKATVTSSVNLAPLQAVFTDSGQFPKWVKMEPTLRGDVNRSGGYQIIVNHDCVVIHGADENGIQNACWTLEQLIEDGPDVPGMEIDDYPIVKYRAVHLDCKGWPPSAEWLRKTIQVLASIKINVLILEYESHFHYDSAPELASEGALTPADIGVLDAFARDRGVTLVPLLSCIGNAAFVLTHDAYKGLREHADYPHMYCAANADAQNFLCGKLGELLPVHQGKIVHVGGDGAFLLGSNQATVQRATELGGMESVYLEHMGVFCRYLISQGVQPLMWDEALRNMSDAQVKWLPPEVAIAFWLPEGLTPDIAPEVLSHLERYKVMKRDLWCGVVISPARDYGGFDNVDAWAEVADAGYLLGFIATVRTRECANNGVLPPFETSWPAVYYAAERAWGGKQIIAREMFPQRFTMRYFGVHNNLERQSRIWAGLDGMLSGLYAPAQVFLGCDKDAVPRNAEGLAFLEAWAAANAFIAGEQEIESEVRGNFLHIQNGSADPLYTGRLRWRVEALKADAPAVISGFTQAATPFFGAMPVHEYVESVLAYTLRRLDELEPLLEAYPLPPEELRV